MGNITSKMGGKTTISAIVTRADGTVEDLGIIASTKKDSLFKRIMKKLKKFSLMMNTIIL